jgi:hypothetical protein
MPRPGPRRIRRSLLNTPGKSRHGGQASIRCRTTNARQSGRDWLKPIAESLCRKNSLLKPISATGESPLHASGVLRPRTSLRIFKRWRTNSRISLRSSGLRLHYLAKLRASQFMLRAPTSSPRFHFIYRSRQLGSFELVIATAVLPDIKKLLRHLGTPPHSAAGDIAGGTAGGPLAGGSL